MIDTKTMFKTITFIIAFVDLILLFIGVPLSICVEIGIVAILIHLIGENYEG